MSALLLLVVEAALSIMATVPVEVAPPVLVHQLGVMAADTQFVWMHDCIVVRWYSFPGGTVLKLGTLRHDVVICMIHLPAKKSLSSIRTLRILIDLSYIRSIAKYSLWVF